MVSMDVKRHVCLLPSPTACCHFIKVCQWQTSELPRQELWPCSICVPQWGSDWLHKQHRITIIIRNSYIAPNPARLAQSTSQFKTRMDIRINTWNIHTPDRSNVNSKAQTNMHTSRNNQRNPDMQCSDTWTMETSYDCKSNANTQKEHSI